MLIDIPDNEVLEESASPSHVYGHVSPSLRRWWGTGAYGQMMCCRRGVPGVLGDDLARAPDDRFVDEGPVG